MDFSSFKNAHDTLSKFGELNRGMDESLVTYCQALFWDMRGDAGVSHEYLSVVRRLHISTSPAASHSVMPEPTSSATQ
jgi:hypothetical protein